VLNEGCCGPLKLGNADYAQIHKRPRSHTTKRQHERSRTRTHSIHEVLLLRTKSLRAPISHRYMAALGSRAPTHRGSRTAAYWAQGALLSLLSPWWLAASAHSPNSCTMRCTVKDSLYLKVWHAGRK
jgi:hypothetical protein